MAKVSLFLHTRYTTPTVKLLITMPGQSRDLSLGVKLDDVSQWSEESEDHVINHPGAKAYNAILKSRLATAQKVLANAELSGEITDIKDLSRIISEAISPKKAEKAAKQAQREELKTKGVLGTYLKVMSKTEGRNWQIYETALRRIREYAEDTHGKATDEDYRRISNGDIPSEPAQRYLESLSWDDITEQWLDGWRECMSDTKSPATQSIYLRCLRHAANYAYDHDYTTKYIFKRYPIPKAKADIRPLTKDEFHDIMTFDLTNEPELQAYRDITWFSFCACGMNIVDIHALTWRQIRNGYIYYTRKKTSRQYVIKITPEMQDIIDQYCTTPKDPDQKVFRWAKGIKHHYDYTHRLNYALKRIGPVDYITNDKNFGRGEKIKQWHPILPDLHFYQFRHTFATFAHLQGCSRDDIAQALGHGRQTVTDIYIDYSQEPVDRTQRLAIDLALQLMRD